jgi:hypothetical protein
MRIFAYTAAATLLIIQGCGMPESNVIGGPNPRFERPANENSHSQDDMHENPVHDSEPTPVHQNDDVFTDDENPGDYTPPKQQDEVGTQGTPKSPWIQKAKQLGISLEMPDDHDALTYKKHIVFFNKGITPKSMTGVPRPARPMTEEEGRKYYFEGMLPMVEQANTPSPSTSEFEAAIREGRIVEPPCATTNSQVLERTHIKAGFTEVATVFANPKHYYPTHNNEFQIQLLGWNYYLKSEYVAPPGAVGAWDRYTFDSIPGHTGHIFIVFKDGGIGGVDLVGDNTRRSDEPHGHPYRMPGKMVGFWLPPGVYPAKR